MRGTYLEFLIYERIVMKYDTLSRNTVKITLTEEDMRRYSLRSEDISKHNTETKRALTGFINRIKGSNPVFPEYETDRLFLEAFPRADGGCILYVSTLGINNTPVERHNIPTLPSNKLMLVTDSVADLAAFSRVLSCIAPETELALYYMGSSFMLIIPASRLKAEKLSYVISEYGELSVSSSEIACAEEHGRLLSASDTLRKLLRLS